MTTQVILFLVAIVFLLLAIATLIILRLRQTSRLYELNTELSQARQQVDKYKDLLKKAEAEIFRQEQEVKKSEPAILDLRQQVATLRLQMAEASKTFDPTSLEAILSIPPESLN